MVNSKLPNWDREDISDKVNGWIKTNLATLLPCPDVVQIVLFGLVDMGCHQYTIACETY